MRSNTEIKAILDNMIAQEPDVQDVIKRDIHRATMDERDYGWPRGSMVEWTRYGIAITHGSHLMDDLTSRERTQFLESLHPANRR